MDKAKLLPAELTEKEYLDAEEICIDLAKKYSTPKVHIYIGIIEETNERVVGYLKDPTYIQKVVAMDKINSVGMFMAAEELREALTLKDESDERTYSTSPSCDGFRLGMAGVCMTMIDVIKNSFKKK